MIKINLPRLLKRINELGKIGSLKGGGVCRLALTDEDKEARDLLVRWMKELQLSIAIDGIGNIIGTRQGRNSFAPPLMIGSHIDTVGTGGLYDGSLGVLAGLEVVEMLNEMAFSTMRPISVVAFTNEEGVRFVPDMMGSQVFQGGLALNETLSLKSIIGKPVTIGEELERIGYLGKPFKSEPDIFAYLELHIEQGPILESEGVSIGVVENLQGISWTEFIIEGVSNHAGTTPMNMRRDVALAVASIVNFVNFIPSAIGNNQVGTVGLIDLSPNLINVIPNHARLVADLRNPDNELLKMAELRLTEFAKNLASDRNLKITSKVLARFNPVEFDKTIINRIESVAGQLGYSYKRMTSGAGHDAQMMARICPTAMIFVPSKDGISHNVSEFTDPKYIQMGANVLLQTALNLIE